MDESRLKIKTIVLNLIVIMCFLLMPRMTYAGSKQMATASNGKFLYFGLDNNIYRMNTNTGNVKRIKTIKSTCYISDVIYYDGYLYFCGDDYGGSDGEEFYIYRMKKNGTNVEKLVSKENTKSEKASHLHVLKI